jgi:hypothetical protein
MEELFNVMCDFPRNPIVWMTLLFGVFSACAAISIAEKLVEVFATVGININHKDKKKWIGLISTTLGTVFVVCVFLHFCFRLYH